jgi:succinate-semialdehyde dehydrogenase/glutarate-semialdehyde dehydrogenase
MYPETFLFIDGVETKGGNDRLPVLNPASGETIGHVHSANRQDLRHAVDAAVKGFRIWRRTSTFDRYKLLRKAADLMRARAEVIGPILTLEQGKPVAEAKREAAGSGDLIDWFAEEGRRAYSRLIPSRVDNVVQMARKEPIGPVACFTPWNFPISQAVRKISAALSVGCSVIIKGPEETPASCAALVRAFHDAGLPPGVLNLVFGVPAEISEYLIPLPEIRKVSFTGSSAVGKHLASLAGRHMKPCTMELGGHAPAIVFEDADLDSAAKLLSTNKFRNAGQICVSPTRLLVHDKIYDAFLSKFIAETKAIKVGNGLEASTTMGPMANIRRIEAMESFVADAVDRGANVKLGGKRIGNEGFFYEPTVLTDVPLEARIMNEEPFGPIAPVLRFDKFEAVVEEANRLPYGLAAYAYTRSAKTAAAIGDAIESGMISINHHGLALPETPFGGVKDSGYGSEGGSEAIEPYLITKFVTQATL